MNMYGYTGNDPVNFVDPFGLFSEEPDVGCGTDDFCEEIVVTSDCDEECVKKRNEERKKQRQNRYMFKLKQYYTPEFCAEALSPNGCGARDGFKVPDAPAPGVSFLDYCNNHDGDFATIGEAFSAANLKFLDGMLGGTVKSSISRASTGDIIGGAQTLVSGTVASFGYFGAVQIFGEEAYDTAQMTAKNCAIANGGK